MDHPESPHEGCQGPHIYLSQQALDIMVALRTCAGGSKYLSPSRYDGDKCMSNATLNRVAQIVVERSKAKGLPIESFSVHDRAPHGFDDPQ